MCVFVHGRTVVLRAQTFAVKGLDGHVEHIERDRCCWSTGSRSKEGVVTEGLCSIDGRLQVLCRRIPLRATRLFVTVPPSSVKTHLGTTYTKLPGTLCLPRAPPRMRHGHHLKRFARNGGALFEGTNVSRFSRLDNGSNFACRRDQPNPNRKPSRPPR